MPITMNHTLKELCELAGGEGGGAAGPGIEMTTTLAGIVAVAAAAAAAEALKDLENMHDPAVRARWAAEGSQGPDLDASGAQRRSGSGPNFRGGRKKSKRRKYSKRRKSGTKIKKRNSKRKTSKRIKVGLVARRAIF
jgi:hypothetical protein